MQEIWFISDTHFGHKNILEYEKEARPFNSIEEMNNEIIDRWNSVVGEKDIIYHLGDFAFGKHNIDLAARLRGRKRLVLGNHDTYPNSLYLQYFEKVYGVVFYNRCVLSHIPVHSGGLGARWLLNIHGHLHSRKVQQSLADVYELQTDKGPIIVRQAFDNRQEDDPNYFNVSCEQNNLTPINWEVIKERLKDL